MSEAIVVVEVDSPQIVNILEPSSRRFHGFYIRLPYHNILVVLVTALAITLSFKVELKTSMFTILSCIIVLWALLLMKYMVTCIALVSIYSPLTLPDKLAYAIVYAIAIATCPSHLLVIDLFTSNRVPNPFKSRRYGLTHILLSLLPIYIVYLSIPYAIVLPAFFDTSTYIATVGILTFIFIMATILTITGVFEGVFEGKLRYNPMFINSFSYY